MNVKLLKLLHLNLLRVFSLYFASANTQTFESKKPFVMLHFLLCTKMKMEETTITHRKVVPSAS